MVILVLNKLVAVVVVVVNRFNSVNWLYRHWIFLGFAESPRDFFGS